MKLLLFMILLVIGTVSCANKNAHIRYANSMPQFGSSTVRGFLPLTTIFTSVPGGFLTSYTTVTARPWIFASEFTSNVTALSFPYIPLKDKFYSLFTYQTQTSNLLNKLVEDRSAGFNATTPVIRTINLLQPNFAVDTFNISNNAPIFTNVEYGEVTSYKPVPPGDYELYWEAADTDGNKKRNVQISGNATGDPYLFPGKAYTHWITPTGTFIVQDGVISTRKRSISTRNLGSRLRKESKKEVQSIVQQNNENDNEAENDEAETKVAMESS